MSAKTQRGNPSTVTVAGDALTIRAMEPEDREAILAFARALPDHDLLFLPQDITEPAQVDAWISEAQEGRIPTVLALRDNEVVGYSSLALSPMTWTRHVGELRVVVAEPIRGKGLGRILTQEAFRIAIELGVEKTVASMTIDQDGAIKMFRRLGFQSEALLRDHVKDRQGQTHDLVVLSHQTALFLATLGVERDESGYRPVVPPMRYPPVEE